MHLPFGLGKKVDPTEEAKEWKRTIQREIRSIERSVLDIGREEQKLLKEMKVMAKQGDARKGPLVILAKDLVRARNAKEKMIHGKAMLSSVQMQIQLQLSTLKVAGVMQRSSEIMHTMNNLVKIPELSQTCRDMAREMEKAGLIEDLMSDAMETMDTTDEEEVDSEVNKVLEELSLNVMQAAPMEPTKKVAAPGASADQAVAAGGGDEQAEAEKAREELELKHMRERLNAL